MALLEVNDLRVDIPTEDGIVSAVQGVSFSVEAGELFGIVGESGSGKSVMTQAITGLLPGARVSGEALLGGEDLLKLNPEQLRLMRGPKIGMIFQDPLSTLHPFYRIADQLAEAVTVHERVSRAAVRDRVDRLLERVGIDPAQAWKSYPHQFSGGMRQRVMIAMALICDPLLVFADEPTTALDVTVQHQIIELLDEMRRELGTTIVMISHDLGLISTVADQMMVLYAGNRMEIGSSEVLFRQPGHPYTAGLLASSPSRSPRGVPLPAIPGRTPSLLNPSTGCAFAERCPCVQAECSSPPPVRIYSDGGQVDCWRTSAAPQPEPVALIETPQLAVVPSPELPGIFPKEEAGDVIAQAVDLRLTYRSKGLRKQHKEVLKGVDLTLRKGQTIGLVGESGCGKSTLARVIAGLLEPTAGRVELVGQDLAGLSRHDWYLMRRKVQLVFQDPIGSLNPKRRVGAIIGDPYRIHHQAEGAEVMDRVKHLMEIVGLKPEHYNRFPGEFSGGERQRIGIARALALNPALIICDEPVSALDVSVQAQVLNLMKELQAEFDLTYLFISHDLAVVQHVSDDIAVMDAGQIVEYGSAEQVFREPQHPFTKRLLEASMHAEPREPGEPRILERSAS